MAAMQSGGDLGKQTVLEITPDLIAGLCPFLIIGSSSKDR
jgi:hypothetical protein